MGMKHEVGSYVRCASSGVCRIEEIRSISVPGMAVKRDYYVLLPVGCENSAVYVPVDNEQMTAEMVPVLTADEIAKAVRAAEADALPWIDDRKERAGHHRQILRRCDRDELLRLISGLHLRRRELSTLGRKLSGSDEATLRQAERLISSELCFALGIEEAQVSEYIRNLLEQQ